jgi:molybdenum cofactor cytidylyltransferase
MNQPPSDRGSETVWALVLAAGESRRFGGGKLTAPVAGQPLIAWSLAALASARDDGYLAGVVVVLPAGDRDLLEALDQSMDPVILAAGATVALAHSLRSGLNALEAANRQPVGAALICLADQPGLRPSTIAALVEAWRSGGGPVVRPRYAECPNQPGHPLLMDRGVWSLAESASGDAGLGPVLRGQPELVYHVDQPGGNPDVDTPAQLAEFERRLK